MCGTTVWDPHTKGKTSQVEKVQRRAARWVSCNYVRLASVTDMTETLGWHSLAQRAEAIRTTAVPIRILIRTTVVPITPLIGTTVMRIRLLIGTTGL